MRNAEAIVTSFRERRDDTLTDRAAMLRVKAVYDGNLSVPVEGAEAPAVANLVLTGVDQTAARIASVVPDIAVPSERKSNAAEKKAQKRKDVWKSWWDNNRTANMLRVRSRYLIAYGMAPAILAPDWDSKCARWRIVDPLRAYPSASGYEDLVPESMIVATERTLAWLRATYPAAATSYDRDLPDHTSIVLLEYSDADQISLVLAGEEANSTWNSERGPVLLEQVPNRTGRPLAVVPKRPVLNRIQGQFDQMIGMYQAQARLTALSIIATDKAVFPDTYLLSNPGELAEFVEGPHDGRSGNVNVVRGGTVQEMGTGPGFNTNPMIDRLERAQRISAAVPSEFGGESNTNIRTGRRGDAILSATIDFPILEAQEAFAEALTHENKIATAIARSYWGNETLTTYRTVGGERVGTTFVPNSLFSSDEHKVQYPVAGADSNSLVVGMGQRIGLGTMSRRTATELDPLIDDPEQENDRVTAESLDTAVLASVQQAAQTGELPPQVIARVADLVRHDKASLSDAVDRATKEYAEAQQAQQEQAQMAGAGMNPLMQEQGLGELAGAGPSVQESPQGMQNLAGMLRTLRNTSNYSDFQQATGEPVRRGPERQTA